MKLFGALLVFLAMTVDASSESSLYYRGFVGVNIMSNFDEFGYVNSGYVFGGTLGYKVQKKLMLEAEVALRENTYGYLNPNPPRYLNCLVEQRYGSVKQVTSFINAVLESSFLGSYIFPSVGIGIGSDMIWEVESCEPLDFAKRWSWRHNRCCVWTPVYQGIVGITAKVGANTQARVGYRHLGWRLHNLGHSLDLSITRGF